MATDAQVNVLIALRSRMQGLNGMLAGVGKLAGGLVAAATAYLGFSRTISESRAVFKLGADLDHLSSRSGVAVSSLLSLQQAFDDAGAGGDAVAITLDRLTRRTQIATQGNNSYAKALESIGLKAEDLTKLDKLTRFQIVGDALQNTADESIRTQAAMDLLDTSAGKLFPLFKDFDGAINDAKAALGELPEVLERNSVRFERFDTILGRTRNKSRQLFTGILDQVGIYLEGPLERLNSIDFTPLGQNIGAGLRLAVKSWEDGTTAELIALSVGAGFEVAFAAVGDLWDGLVGYISKPTTWVKLADGWLTHWQNMVKFSGAIVLTIGEYLAAGLSKALDEGLVLFDKLGAAVKPIFASVVNFLAEKLESVINSSISGLNTILEALHLDPVSELSLGRVSAMKGEIRQAATFAQHLAREQALGQQYADLLATAVDGSANFARDLLGIETELTEEGDKQLTNREKLALLLQQMKDDREAEARIEPTTTGGGYTAPGDEDPLGLAAANDKALDLAATMEGAVGGSLDVLTGKSQGWLGVLQGAVDSVWTPIRDAIAQTTVAIFRQHVLKQNLEKTETQNWLTNLFTRKAAASAVKAADTAENAAKGAADAAAMAPAAGMAATASFGLAPLLALAGLAAVVAFASSGFALGGYTGDGAKYQPAGIVHAGEYVLPQETVQALGVQNLDYLRDYGRFPGYASGGYVRAALPSSTPAPSASRSGGTQIAFFDSRRSAEEFASSSEFEVRVLDILDAHADAFIGG